jgi:hypothetical protein
VCRLTEDGARKMITLSPLIEAKSELAVSALAEISF